MSKDTDRKKAEELLKKLHAAFPDEVEELDPKPEEDETPEEIADEAPEADETPEEAPETVAQEPEPAAEEPEEKPEPVAEETLEEPAPEEAAEEPETEEPPEEPEPVEPEEEPEEPEPVEPEEPADVEEPTRAAAPAAILALTEDAPDVTGKNPTDPTTLKAAEAKNEATKPAPAKKTRPNAVKIPPRRKSGVNTGAIGQQRPAAPATPAVPPQKRPPAGKPQMGDISAPRVGTDRVTPPPAAQEPPARITPKEIVSGEVPQKPEQTPAEATLRVDVPKIVDFDAHASSTVEPIENTEATETVSDPSANKQPRPKKVKNDEELDATTVIAKRTGLDESDIALIFELGYENELGRLVGYETLKKLKYEHLRHSRLNSGDYYGQAFGYRGKEYTSAVPAENVLAAYAHDRKRLIWRIALMALLSVLLFFADFPVVYAAYLPQAITGLFFLFPSISLLLFSVGIFLTGRRILAGWRAFLKFEPTPYSVVAFAVPFLWLYGVGTIVSSILAPGAALPPMNFAATTALLLMVICDAVRIADEVRTFKMVSLPELKTVLEEVEPRKKKLRQGNRTVKIINDEAGQSLYRVRRAHEVVGFFRRMNDLSAASGAFTRMIVFTLICAVAGGFAASLIFSNPVRGVLVFAATLAFSIPASAIFLFFDPLRRANRHLISRRSVLVGEGSVNEYSRSKTIIFNDTNAFRAKRQTQVDLPDGDEFRRDIRLAEALFRKVGGTLATVDQPILMEEDPNMTINLVQLTETGVEALIDNKYRILAGDAAFLLHNGVNVPRESTDRSVGRSRGVSALYVAINGTLKLTYEIAYTMNQSFREILSLLVRTDTTLAVQSYDPNLNDAFLHIGFADGDEVVRVIKPAQFEIPTTSEITDTGAVTLDGPLATAYPLRAAALIVRARQSGFRALLTSIFPGALLAFFLAWLLPANLIPFLPLMAVGYRLIWLAVSWMISLVSLRRHAVFEDTRENLANENQNAK